MPNILFISNTANFSKFNRPYMQLLRKKGWVVHYASSGEESIADCDKSYKIDIRRSPYSFKNIKAIRVLKTIISKNKYDVIHCHTPMGGVIARLAGKKFRKEGLKIIYTAHGFHFYKGAPFFNWLFYCPIEKYFSLFTDVLITLNKEDYNFAKNFFYMKHLYLMDGVGVDLTRFFPIKMEEKEILRNSIGFSKKDFILLCIAEFIPRKNHKLLFNLIPRLSQTIPNLKIILAGKGMLFDSYKRFIYDNNWDDVVSFLGYVNNIDDYCRISDILIAPSFQEGLPISLIEALATGLPIVCSAIRGHIDLIKNGENGFLCDLDSEDDFFYGVVNLYNDDKLRQLMRVKNIQHSEKFSIEKILKFMEKIYTEIL